MQLLLCQSAVVRNSCETDRTAHESAILYHSLVNSSRVYLFLVFLAVIVRLVLMAMSIISATKFWSSWVPFVNVVRIVKVGEMPILISHNTLCSSRFLQHPIDSYHKKERRKQTHLMDSRGEMLVLTQHLHFL